MYKMINLLATLNENPYIRYYQPNHHPPLGPLANQQTGATLAAPPPASQSLRWRSAVGDQGSARSPGQGAPGVGGPTGPEYLSGKIAKRIQEDLDEYMVNNPEFPVSPCGVLGKRGYVVPCTKCHVSRVAADMSGCIWSTESFTFRRGPFNRSCGAAVA